jgi:hypothetical protein
MEFDITKYRKSTIIKIVIVIAMIVIPILLAMVLIPQYANTFNREKTNQNIDANFASQVCAFILLLFIESICIYKLSCFIRVETNEEFAKKYYIKTHDEREQYIAREANALAMRLNLYILGICAAISGLYDMKVFIALISTFVVEILIFVFTYIYFKYKN